MADTTDTTTRPDWQAWQRSWDRQQEHYLPDREERFRTMLDVVEAAVGRTPRVLDLACGTGSISDRLLTRMPDAHSTGVDLDPALLTLARGHFADDKRVEFVRLNLRDADWTDHLPHRQYDAVLTATALHWLTHGELVALYGRIAGVLRPGGVFLNVDHMPDPTTPRIDQLMAVHDRARRAEEKERGVLDWVDWWRALEEEPSLAEVVAERHRVFADPAKGDHAADQMQSPAWHVEVLRHSGFTEARTVWASPRDAMVLGLK
ncbi:class I SAM-dependent methyltransferase [Streptomyces sp. OF3]|uniref:Class I SAM-dependent methyltransferase n=1 Tax=Streptomyces alkaliterrae TaxID=2213162 RepID=A0A7W3WIJ5_9ACTN|nr:class I SAM-dependent methyltransferase [Streptomyces alkaliterrae]MBB1252830.1 class I SAM-dependent methyltransferase [Streptomyces alkaliterrae]